MATQKIAHLISSLLIKSRTGNLVWKSTSESGTFVVSFPRQSIVVAPYRDIDGSEEYKLQLCDSFGEVIEDIIPSDYSQFLDQPYSVFREIYDLARSSAMGVDIAVDEILSILDRESPD